MWIDFLRERITPQVNRLIGLFASDQLAVADLTLTEVLQGIDGDNAFTVAESLLADLPLIETVGGHVAIAAARNFRMLRRRGITVRKTIDTLLATLSIEDGHALLFSDRDFEPFVEHLGLISAMAV